MGTQVVVPYREEDEKRHLKPMGDLGQIVPMVGIWVVLLLCIKAKYVFIGMGPS